MPNCVLLILPGYDEESKWDSEVDFEHSFLKEKGEMNREDLSALLGDLCRFRCVWCDFQDSHYDIFCQHVQEEHESKIPYYLLEDDAESYAEKLVLTACHICSESLLLYMTVIASQGISNLHI